MHTSRLVYLALVGVVVATLGVMTGGELRPLEPLREVYTPTYRAIPVLPPVRVTISHLWRDLRSASGRSFLQRMLPNQAGVLWLSLIVALLVAFDFDNPATPRNID